jgi:hypothetical protein
VQIHHPPRVGDGKDFHAVRKLEGAARFVLVVTLLFARRVQWGRTKIALPRPIGGGGGVRPVRFAAVTFAAHHLSLLVVILGGFGCAATSGLVVVVVVVAAAAPGGAAAVCLRRALGRCCCFGLRHAASKDRAIDAWCAHCSSVAGDETIRSQKVLVVGNKDWVETQANDKTVCPSFNCLMRLLPEV